MKIKDLIELFDLSFYQVKILLNEYADLEIERNHSANSEVYRENDTIIIKAEEKKGERMTDLTLEKRIENLEKMYLMLQEDIDKKLEMLRENNNLFAEEIKKLGGFKEDEEVE